MYFSWFFNYHDYFLIWIIFMTFWRVSQISKQTMNCCNICICLCLMIVKAFLFQCYFGYFIIEWDINLACMNETKEGDKTNSWDVWPNLHDFLVMENNAWVLLTKKKCDRSSWKWWLKYKCFVSLFVSNQYIFCKMKDFYVCLWNCLTRWYFVKQNFLG